MLSALGVYLSHLLKERKDREINMLTTQGKEKHRKSGYLVDSLKNVLRKGPVPYIYGLPGSLRERIQSRGKKTKGMNDESSLLMTLPVNKGNKPVSSFKETQLTAQALGSFLSHVYLFTRKEL